MCADCLAQDHFSVWSQFVFSRLIRRLFANLWSEFVSKFNLYHIRNDIWNTFSDISHLFLWCDQSACKALLQDTTPRAFSEIFDPNGCHSRRCKTWRRLERIRAMFDYVTGGYYWVAQNGRRFLVFVSRSTCFICCNTFSFQTLPFTHRDLRINPVHILKRNTVAFWAVDLFPYLCCWNLLQVSVNHIELNVQWYPFLLQPFFCVLANTGCTIYHYLEN